MESPRLGKQFATHGKWATTQDWERMKLPIRELYLDKDKTLTKVMEVMEKDYGFRAT